MNVPTLHTKRLTLRGPTRTDFDAFEAATAARDWYWANTDAPLPTGETRADTTAYRHRRAA